MNIENCGLKAHDTENGRNSFGIYSDFSGKWIIENLSGDQMRHLMEVLTHSLPQSIEIAENDKYIKDQGLKPSKLNFKPKEGGRGFEIQNAGNGLYKIVNTLFNLGGCEQLSKDQALYFIEHITSGLTDLIAGELRYNKKQIKSLD